VSTASHWRLVLLAALLTQGASGLPSQEPAARSSPRQNQGPARILFIGNSYTYYNNLPEILAALAAAAGEGNATVRMAASGGWKLKDHWERGEALGLLWSDPWDYVVLQEQSTLGVNYYVEGRTRIAGDELFRPYAIRWAAEARKVGATPVFYLTWAPREAPEDQDRLNRAYFRAGRDSAAIVAPAGMAWSQMRREHPEIGLFSGAGSHPSSAGTYLVACSLFAAIFDRSPVGLPAKIVGHPVDLETEKVEQDSTVPLANLSPSEARTLQSAAWATHARLKKHGGYLQFPETPPPTVAELPRGRSLAGADGTWLGTIAFYPVGPVEMALQLEGDPVHAGRLELKYKSQGFTDESIELRDLRIDDDASLSFSDPASTGVDGLRVRFRGVRTGPNELRGTAETTRDTPDSPVRVLGSWRLLRHNPGRRSPCL
jgi:hypothetical protein